MDTQLSEYISSNLGFIAETAKSICSIPSMTGSEETKARRIRGILWNICCSGARLPRTTLFAFNTGEASVKIDLQSEEYIDLPSLRKGIEHLVMFIFG